MAIPIQILTISIFCAAANLPGYGVVPCCYMHTLHILTVLEKWNICQKNFFQDGLKYHHVHRWSFWGNSENDYSIYRALLQVTDPFASPRKLLLSLHPAAKLPIHNSCTDS